MSDLFTDAWGSGPDVVLVHGSLSTGADEWHAQQPLSEDFRLLVPDRRGYGRSPAAEGEDFVRDAEDIIDLMDGGAHLVGHSYGALGAMLAAARRPQSTRSLALLEPPVFAIAPENAAAQRLSEDVRRVWGEEQPDDQWVVAFLRAVGTDPAQLPPGVLEEIVPLVPLLRRGRPVFDHEPPVDELASGAFPTLVVSGGHSDGFEAVCDELAEEIGASRAVVEGAGHEIQFTGPPLNDLLLDLWREASSPTARAQAVPKSRSPASPSPGTMKAR